MRHHFASMLLLGCTLPALAQQSANDIEVLTRYAGTWAVDCVKAGTRLGVDVKQLTLQSGASRLATNVPPMAAFSYFGQQQPPKGFVVALLGDAPSSQLVFFVMNDAFGPHLTVQADGPTLKQFGKPALAGKFRRCP